MPKTTPTELFTPRQNSEPNPLDPLTIVGTLRIQPDFSSVLSAKFVEPFFHEVETCAQELALPPLAVEPAEFLEGAKIRASIKRPVGSLWLAQFDEVALLVSCGPRATSVQLRSACPESLKRVAATLTARAPAPVGEGDQVLFDFWQVANQPFTTSRRITAPAYEDSHSMSIVQMRRLMGYLRSWPSLVNAATVMQFFSPRCRHMPRAGTQSLISSTALAQSRFEMPLAQ